MPLIQILIVLIVIGVVLWLINSYIPMNRTIKGIVNVVVIVFAIIFVLHAFGVWNSMWNYRM